MILIRLKRHCPNNWNCGLEIIYLKQIEDMKEQLNNKKMIIIYLQQFVRILNFP